MKKTLLALLLLGAAGLSASAQTEFRHISFDEACTAAKNENKLVFIDFFTDWCGPCKKMSAQTFPEKAVGDFMNAKFIPVKYNAEKEGVDLAKRFQIKAYPTYIIANDKGEEVARFSGYMESEQFIDKVNAALDPEMKPERIAARYQSGERTPKLVNTYAMQVLQESKDEKAGLKIIDDYFNSLTDEQRVAPENAFIFLTYTVNLDDPRSIYLDKNIDRFPAETKAKAMERLQRLYSSKFSTRCGRGSRSRKHVRIHREAPHLQRYRIPRILRRESQQAFEARQGNAHHEHNPTHRAQHPRAQSRHL